jgi:hypothetical protein
MSRGELCYSHRETRLRFYWSQWQGTRQELDEDSALDKTISRVAVCVIGRRKYEGFPPFLIVLRGRPARNCAGTQNFRVPNDPHHCAPRTPGGIHSVQRTGSRSGCVSKKMKDNSKHWFDVHSQAPRCRCITCGNAQQTSPHEKYYEIDEYSRSVAPHRCGVSMTDDKILPRL